MSSMMIIVSFVVMLLVCLFAIAVIAVSLCASGSAFNTEYPEVDDRG